MLAQRLKASACNAGDLSLIPGSGGSPGEGNGNPFQYSCLENPMDGGAWWATVHGVAKSQTRLSDFTFHKGWLYLLLDSKELKWDKPEFWGKPSQICRIQSSPLSQSKKRRSQGKEELNPDISPKDIPRIMYPLLSVIKYTIKNLLRVKNMKPPI